MDAMARDFWRSAGLHLVTRNPDGWLNVTADYLRAYLTRPEVHPVDESNPHEVQLHEALLADPFRPVSEADVVAIVDKDAIDTYRLVLAFRDVLTKAGTIEGAYLALMTGKTPLIVPALVSTSCRRCFSTRWCI
jgi:hypothetical protein